MAAVKASATAAEVLGIQAGRRRPLSPMALMAKVDAGLPLSALERVARSVAPDDNAFLYRLVPRPTLARRRKQEPGAAKLSPEEGAKVTRLAEVWALCREVWGGDEAARAFLHRPHPLLDGRRPLDVMLSSELGRPLVEGILGRLQYGSAA